MPFKLTINDKPHEVDVDPETPLLWVLRDTIGLTGTKYGCGIARAVWARLQAGCDGSGPLVR